ncbi:MAG: rRNA maturation RNase YbeY [Sphaerochaetaceae bacterium]|jgi:probable rRNA maturation factor|nr:rRNA maturation RNase YbeY [Sphaerochaetaceae bacterium]NLO61132.1 rRNA maturation RNase YbeY [Spirochaetales bacterium]MDD2405644.1 rRNA maturation RNase YbeY [Sphaerochaetaceae bacterium]MDD3670423.1 rRNA maturation RNase YbeY [Sphaerochaetaceae bacterium]MDD4260429.1 rRNA maturation RNase YbeY [Sphaerochaetaceae bacterium]
MNNKVFVSFEVEDVSDEQIENNVIRNALSVLDHLGVHDAELSCSFVSDNTIRQLNKEYRDKDEATDVLSFPQEEKIAGQANWPAILIEGEQPVPRILGDLVISMESVKRNCVTFDVQCDEEVDRLIIHGILHLLGQDHSTNDADEPMLLFQESLLRTIREESPN